MHGILACSGDGGRFAESIGKAPPYLKHLEMINGKTVLERSLHDMAVLFTESISVTVKPDFVEPYAREIARIAGLYPSWQLSIMPDERISGWEFPIEQVAGAFAKVELYNPAGERVSVPADGRFVLGAGDQFIDPGYGKWRQMKEIVDSMQRGLMQHKVALINATSTDGLLYVFGWLDDLASFRHCRHQDEDMDVQVWNINVKRDLDEARVRVYSLESRVHSEMKG